MIFELCQKSKWSFVIVEFPDHTHLLFFIQRHGVIIRVVKAPGEACSPPDHSVKAYAINA